MVGWLRSSASLRSQTQTSPRASAAMIDKRRNLEGSAIALRIGARSVACWTSMGAVRRGLQHVSGLGGEVKVADFKGIDTHRY